MKNMLLMLLCVLLTTLLAAAAVRAESPYERAETPLTLFAVNVGKGDALLLNCGSDTYLIDTALSEHWGDVSRALNVLEVSHLTGVIVTHTDKDHIGGLKALATSSITVDGWYAPAHYADIKKESRHPAVEAAAIRGESVIFLRAGDVLPLGTGRLTVVGPVNRSETENCNSLVLVAEASGGRMLLTGDMEFPEEEELLKAGSIPECGVIKIANHGEGDATSEALIRAVNPEVAVISTSTAAEPDTPDERVMALLNSREIKVYQTQDSPSGVLVTIDQGEITANSMHYSNIPAQTEGVRIASVDAKDDVLILRNDGDAPADLSGWYILSERGGEIFVLPQGTHLAPGATLTIVTQSSDAPGDLIWPDKKVWHEKKDDPAHLYDAYGREADHAKT